MPSLLLISLAVVILTMWCFNAGSVFLGCILGISLIAAESWHLTGASDDGIRILCSIAMILAAAYGGAILVFRMVGDHTLVKRAALTASALSVVVVAAQNGGVPMLLGELSLPALTSAVARVVVAGSLAAAIVGAVLLILELPAVVLAGRWGVGALIPFSSLRLLVIVAGSALFCDALVALLVRSLRG